MPAPTPQDMLLPEPDVRVLEAFASFATAFEQLARGCEAFLTELARAWSVAALPSSRALAELHAELSGHPTRSVQVTTVLRASLPNPCPITVTFQPTPELSMSNRMPPTPRRLQLSLAPRHTLPDGRRAIELTERGVDGDRPIYVVAVQGPRDCELGASVETLWDPVTGNPFQILAQPVPPDHELAVFVVGLPAPGDPCAADHEVCDQRLADAGHTLDALRAERERWRRRSAGLPEDEDLAAENARLRAEIADLRGEQERAPRGKPHVHGTIAEASPDSTELRRFMVPLLDEGRLPSDVSALLLRKAKFLSSTERTRRTGDPRAGELADPMPLRLPCVELPTHTEVAPGDLVVGTSKGVVAVRKGS